MDIVRTSHNVLGDTSQHRSRNNLSGYNVQFDPVKRIEWSPHWTWRLGNGPVLLGFIM